MTPRALVATCSAAALVSGLLTGATGVSAASAAEATTAVRAECLSDALSSRKAVRTSSGAKLGTAQVFGATRGDDLGFCVRITPVPRLRRTTTVADLKHQSYFPDGSRSSSGAMGGSGVWRSPFLLTGSDFGPGYSLRGVARIKVPGGPSGKVKVQGTLPAPGTTSGDQAAARGRISWGPTTLTPESPSYAVSGRLTGKRRVLLQHRVAGSWRTLDRATSRRGRYSLAGTWEWYGQHPVRVLAPRTRGRGAKTLGRTTFTVSPSVAPRGLPSEYRPYNSDGREFRFNPCRPVRWRFNSGGGVGDPLFGQLQGAVTEISRATGIEFEYVGSSQTVPVNVEQLEKGTDLVVAFTSSTQAPALGPATAVGGIVRAVDGRSGKRRVWRITDAGVSINSDKLLAGGYSLEESSASPTAKLVLMHELGHAMGLDHVTTPGSETQVMFSGSTYMTPWDDGLHHPRWGAGDIAGLSHLGLGSGCVR